MARSKTEKPALDQQQAPSPPPAGPLQELGLADLARAILSREIRPRVADMRRLAEGVLATEVRPGKESEQAKGKKGKGGAGKKSGGKKHKLAKIPRPKSKK